MQELPPRARTSRHLAALVAASLGLAGLTFACASATAKAPAADDPACAALLCPHDPEPAQASVDACNTILQGSCGVTYHALVDCFQQHAVCDANEQTDVQATENACASAQDAYDQCAPVPDAGFSSG